jgi:hypothetical protein
MIATSFVMCGILSSRLEGEGGDSRRRTKNTETVTLTVSR